MSRHVKRRGASRETFNATILLLLHLRTAHGEPTGATNWRLQRVRRLHQYLHNTDVLQRHLHPEDLKRWPPKEAA